MNILVVTSAYPMFDGDATAPFVASITEHVAAKGHSMHVVLPEHHDWSRAAVEGNVHFHPYRYSPRRSWTPWGFAQSLEAGVKLKRPLYALAPSVFVSARRMCRTLAARERFDVIHAHWLIPNGTIAAAVRTRRPIPLVVTLHGSDISLSERSRWLRSLARRTLARTAVVTAPSDDLLERARKLGAKGDLELIAWGADPESFRPDSIAASRIRDRYRLQVDDVLVLGIGRFIHAKGFAYLIEAVAQARATTPGLRLVFLGDGDLRSDLVAQTDRLGLSDQVSFAGMVPRNDVAAHLAAADVVAVPSVHFRGFVDGQPTVALEAMAAGKPLVATRVGGLPQLVLNGENGLLVEERDPSALADAILTLARDPDLRRRMGDRSRQRILESLTWDEVAKRMVAAYERAQAHTRVV